MAVNNAEERTILMAQAAHPGEPRVATPACVVSAAAGQALTSALSAGETVWVPSQFQL